MCNMCNTGYNGYGCGATNTWNICGGCCNNGQRVCRDACGNLRVYTCGGCGSCGCAQSNNGTAATNGNGYTSVTVCGNAYSRNAVDTATTETTYPYNCGCRRCGGCFGN